MAGSAESASGCGWGSPAPPLAAADAAAGRRGGFTEPTARPGVASKGARAAEAAIMVEQLQRETTRGAGKCNSCIQMYVMEPAVAVSSSPRGGRRQRARRRRFAVAHAWQSPTSCLSTCSPPAEPPARWQAGRKHRHRKANVEAELCMHVHCTPGHFGGLALGSGAAPPFGVYVHQLAVLRNLFRIIAITLDALPTPSWGMSANGWRVFATGAVAAAAARRTASSASGDVLQSASDRQRMTVADWWVCKASRRRPSQQELCQRDHWRQQSA